MSPPHRDRRIACSSTTSKIDRSFLCSNSITRVCLMGRGRKTTGTRTRRAPPSFVTDSTHAPRRTQHSPSKSDVDTQSRRSAASSISAKTYSIDEEEIQGVENGPPDMIAEDVPPGSPPLVPPYMEQAPAGWIDSVWAPRLIRGFSALTSLIGVILALAVLAQ